VYEYRIYISRQMNIAVKCKVNTDFFTKWVATPFDSESIRPVFAASCECNMNALIEGFSAINFTQLKRHANALARELRFWRGNFTRQKWRGGSGGVATRHIVLLILRIYAFFVFCTANTISASFITIIILHCQQNKRINIISRYSRYNIQKYRFADYSRE